MTNYLKIGPIALLNPTDFIDGVIGKDDSGKALKGPDGKPIKFLRVFSVSGRRYDFKEPEAQLVRDFLAGVLSPKATQWAGQNAQASQTLLIPRTFDPEKEFEKALPNFENIPEIRNAVISPISNTLPKLQIHKIKETIEKRGTE